MRWRVAVTLIGAVLTGVALSSAPAAAQRFDPAFRQTAAQTSPSISSLTQNTETGAGTLAHPRWSVDDVLPKWSAPIASAIVPGTGQAMLHQQRFLAYLAVEGFVWLQYFKDVRDWHQQRAAYRNLAAQVARQPFTAQPALGDWDYYERMEHYLESGVYSLSGSMTNVQPETDETTYNGAMWALARNNFWPNPAQTPATNSPEYQNALAFYESRATTPEFRWSWRNAQLEQDLYRKRINKANDAVRRATADLGVILANHVLSAVDAFTTFQLQMHADHGASGTVLLEWQLSTPFP